MDSPPNEKMTQGYEVAPTTTNSDTEQKGKEHGTSDLYLDPKKERKMMLKFDVSPEHTHQKGPGTLTLSF